MIKLFLFDIEGTTTDINFVHKVLFPYSNEHIESFVLKNPSKIHDLFGEMSAQEVIRTLKSWIKEDKKEGRLKEIQGLIWDEGYKQGHFKGHVYTDVKAAFETLSQKAKVGIYSSGSVYAQKLIFGFSEAGDLTKFISYYFDTNIGHKREQSSYENIAKEVKLAPNEILFFSDIPEELEAAQKAGLKVTHVLRDGTLPSQFPSVYNFENI